MQGGCAPPQIPKGPHFRVHDFKTPLSNALKALLNVSGNITRMHQKPHIILNFPRIPKLL